MTVIGSSQEFLVKPQHLHPDSKERTTQLGARAEKTAEIAISDC